MSNPLIVASRDNSNAVNNAGGKAFLVNDEQRFRRFLVIGTAGGTFYASEQKITEENVKFVKSFIAKNGARALEIAAEVSDNALAYRNSPAIFTLAVAFTSGYSAEAKEVFNKIVRIPTHLFEFAEYIEGLGGWGRSKRTAVAGWYSSKTDENLAYAVAKYRQRNGWTHRDMWRLSHPKNINSAIGEFVLKGEVIPEAPLSLQLFSKLQGAKSAQQVASIIEASGPNVAWEFIPTEFLTDPIVWKALFYAGALKGQALVHNVSRLNKNGAFTDIKFAGDYGKLLSDEEMIVKTRLHPMNYLLALYTPAQDYYHSSTRAELPSKIAAGLENGFYSSFKTIKPSGKRTLVATDVSGSMMAPANGVGISCSVLSAVLGMTIVRSEPYAEIVGFSSKVRDLGINETTSLDAAIKKVGNQTFGGTDTSAAIGWLNQNKIDVDSINIITDNETWAAHSYSWNRSAQDVTAPAALKAYRHKVGHDVSLAVVGMTATEFGIIDENDSRSMNVAGFSSDAPAVLADFAAGRV